LCLEPIGFEDRHDKIIDVPAADKSVLGEEPEVAIAVEAQEVQGGATTNAVIIPDRDPVIYPTVAQLAGRGGAVARQHRNEPGLRVAEDTSFFGSTEFRPAAEGCNAGNLPIEPPAARQQLEYSSIHIGNRQTSLDERESTTLSHKSRSRQRNVYEQRPKHGWIQALYGPSLFD
jgi:hypothetical protein